VGRPVRACPPHIDRFAKYVLSLDAAGAHVREGRRRSAGLSTVSVNVSVDIVGTAHLTC
jgi:hypothetical protein